MSDDSFRSPTGIVPFAETQVQPWQEPGPGYAGMPRSPLERPTAAVRRYKWIILAVITVSVAAGVVMTRFIRPEYEVRASILISSDSPMQERIGPIRSSRFLNS